LLCAVVPDVAKATEAGGSSKAVGVDTVLCGVMPDPGLLLTTYLGYYNSDHTLDSSGHDRAGISNFHLRAESATLRFQQVWSGVELWGANIETRVGFTPYIDINVHFDVQTPNGPVHRQSSASGTADALLGPALLGWHGEHLHQIAGVEFFLPTGHFDKTKLANQGRDYYAIAPAYFFTWFPNDATEVSGNLFYLINTKNHDTNYRSGNELSFDYGLSYALTPTWQLGASGYLYKQIADDKQGGLVVGDGNRGRAVAIGPFLRYHVERNWGLTLKWQHEALVENKTRGDRLFLQFAYRLW
jgi:hypothetical protein